MTSSSRQSYVAVDPSAIEHNVARIRKLVAPHAAVMAVVKANAYGHGMIMAARAGLAGGATALGVATADEALTLRETAGFHSVDILVMAPSLPDEAFALQRARIAVAVGNRDLLQTHLAAAKSLDQPARIHIQIDTGIGRDGYRFDDLSYLQDLANETAHFEGLFMHFSVADSLDPEHIRFTALQHDRYQDVLRAVRKAGHDPLPHCGNSGAVLHHRSYCHGIVRPGMLIYGVDPGLPQGPPEGFRPALSVKSRLAAIRQMEKGDTVSYGRTWTVPARQAIGIVPMGYGDGYLRNFSSKGEVLIRGKRVPIRGRVCMDQFMIDLSGVPDADLGDEVVLYGTQGTERITLEEAAAVAGTIPYELTCVLTPRLPRVYHA